MKKLKAIPKFKSEDEEREFWATADTSEYFDWSRPKRAAFPNPRPSTSAISLRLPDSRIKERAKTRDIPYQSLMKLFLARTVEEECRRKTGRRLAR